jgi:hypothetical protein
LPLPFYSSNAYFAREADFLHVLVQGARVLLAARRQPGITANLAQHIELALSVLQSRAMTESA